MKIMIEITETAPKSRHILIFEAVLNDKPDHNLIPDYCDYVVYRIKLQDSKRTIFDGPYNQDTVWRFIEELKARLPDRKFTEMAHE